MIIKNLYLSLTNLKKFKKELVILDKLVKKTKNIHKLNIFSLK